MPIKIKFRKPPKGWKSKRKKKNVGQLTKLEAKYVKDIINEEKEYKDIAHAMTDLSTTLASVQPDGDAAGPFFTLNGEATVDGAAVTVPAERDGDSVTPLTLDLRVAINFASPHEQFVRLILVSFGDDDGRSGAQILNNTAQTTTNPMRVIQSFRKMNPDIKFNVLEQVTVSSKPNSMAGDETTGSRTRLVRFFHKFGKGSKMNYAGTANEEPDTNAIYLYAVYAQGRLTAGGNYANTVAPSIAYTARQRYIR